MCTTAPVPAYSALHRATSPHRNTRSHGTSTLSNTTTASISSKRDASGLSKRERPTSYASRQRNFKPLTLHWIANDSANGSAAGSAFNTVEGNKGSYSLSRPRRAGHEHLP